MSDVTFFANRQLPRELFLSVEHGTDEITLTFHDTAADRMRLGLHYLKPAEARGLAADLLRRADAIEATAAMLKETQ